MKSRKIDGLEELSGHSFSLFRIEVTVLWAGRATVPVGRSPERASQLMWCGPGTCKYPPPTPARDSRLEGRMVEPSLLPVYGL